MKIANARITNVMVGFDARDGLYAKMTFETMSSACYGHFYLLNAVDAQRLSTLMDYTRTYDIKDLDGKIIRKVDLNSRMVGFGHPIEDRFVPLSTKGFIQVTENEYEKMLTSK